MPADKTLAVFSRINKKLFCTSFFFRKQVLIPARILFRLFYLL